MPSKKTPDPTDKHVGNKVHMRRITMGWSQQKLGDALGLTFQQVQKYEKGTNRISASRLQRISDILQVPLEYFFEGAPHVEGMIETKGAPSVTDLSEFVASSEGLALIKAFMGIQQPRLRRSIVDLVEAIAVPGSVKRLVTRLRIADWFALTLTTHPSDSATTPRGVGSYLVYQPADGVGIRPTPYSDRHERQPGHLRLRWPVRGDDPFSRTASATCGTGCCGRCTGTWSNRYGFHANLYGPWWSMGGNNLAHAAGDGRAEDAGLPARVSPTGATRSWRPTTALTGGANTVRDLARVRQARPRRPARARGRSRQPERTACEAFDLPADLQRGDVRRVPAAGQENAPSVNQVNAGATVPVKFALSGGDLPPIDSQPVDCTSLVPTGEAPQPVDSPGSTGLSRNGDDYHVNWKTDPMWAGTCRRLTIRIPSASDAVAYFSFF